MQKEQIKSVIIQVSSSTYMCSYVMLLNFWFTNMTYVNLLGSSKWGKKPPSLDDDRRSTYEHYSHNSSLFAAFDDERKLLVPVSTS